MFLPLDISGDAQEVLTINQCSYALDIFNNAASIFL